MGRETNRLTARAVAALSEPGVHADGQNLYLRVDDAGAKRWVFIFSRSAKRVEMGLGSIHNVSLQQARELAAEARAHLGARRDPLAERRKQSGAPTFAKMAAEVLDSIEGSFRNDKHRAQWHSTLRTYCGSIAALPVDQIETAHALEVLKPIWTTKAETASRLRGRVERILDAARAKGHRTGENPFRWRGHLDQLLPPRGKLTRGHHAAMKYSDLPAFIGDLRERDGVTPLALEFAILTAARSGEVRGARWAEIDRDARVWVIPAERMKAGKEHRVPLTDRCFAILAEIEPLRLDLDADELLFPGARRNSTLSDQALSAVLRRMGLPDLTVHGFRSSFRDWVSEETHFPRELAEGALAHIVGSAVERSYRRGDALEKRRELMNAWERYCHPPVAGNVVPMRRAEA